MEILDKFGQPGGNIFLLDPCFQKRTAFLEPSYVYTRHPAKVSLLAISTKADKLSFLPRSNGLSTTSLMAVYSSHLAAALLSPHTTLVPAVSLSGIKLTTFGLHV